MEKSPAQRLVNVLWTLLDSPKRADFEGWLKQATSLLKDDTFENIRDVMKFALRENDYSIEYLLAAKDPMASFVKNYEDLSRRCRAVRKAQAVREKRENQKNGKGTGKLPRLCPHRFHLGSWECPVCLRDSGLDPFSPDDRVEARKLYNGMYKSVG